MGVLSKFRADMSTNCVTLSDLLKKVPAAEAIINCKKYKGGIAVDISCFLHKILKTKEDHVIIVFDENPKENWFLAGKQL